MAPAERDQFMSEADAYLKEFGETGELLAANGFALADPSTAKTVRVRNGLTDVTDGPFAEAKEQVGGYYLIDVPSIEEAVEWGKKIPLLPSDKLEVRKKK
jgi:hypothetical protein